jgi:D-3-phosphoglycerate dehydrogenase
LRHSAPHRPCFNFEVARMSANGHEHRLDPLVLDLIEWLVPGPRPYAEVMEAWRTTCARLPVWEEAVDRGLVVSEMVSPGCVLVTVTPAGRSFFAMRRHVPC